MLELFSGLKHNHHSSNEYKECSLTIYDLVKRTPARYPHTWWPPGPLIKPGQSIIK